MSTLYSLLESKANNPITRDQLIYAEMPEKVETSDYNKCIGFTNLNFYNLVNFYIKVLKSNPAVTSVIFVDNSVASNAMILAMRAIGMTAVLIDTSSRQIFNAIPAPFVYIDDHKSHGIADYYVKSVVIPNLPQDTKGDIIICSSGSETSKPHFTGFTEEQLLNLKRQYGEDGSTFYSYISSANISGILTNIVNPLANDCKAVMRTRFDLALFDKNSKPEEIIFDEYLLSERNPELVEQLFYGNLENNVIKVAGNKLLVGKLVNKVNPIDRVPIYKKLNLTVGSLDKLGLSIDEMMFPRDIISHLNNYDCSKLNCSSLKHIYLAGGINSKDTVKKIREKIPSIKDGVLTNLYGATEAGGVICSSKEENFRPCYIDATDSLNGKIIYTFDKINFFCIENGKTRSVDADFIENRFIEFLPVSDKKESNVTVKDDFTVVFDDVSGNNKIESTDTGVYIDDQLYIIGRKSSMITFGNKSYFLSTFEEYFSRKLGTDTYCILTPENRISIFINCGDKDLNYKLKMYDKALKISEGLNANMFNYPVILDKDSFPKIEISGKISRAQFEKYRQFGGRQHYNFKLREDSKKETFSKIINEYLANYDVKKVGEYFISINVKKQYFYDLVIASTFFDIVSFDDKKGEIILKFNDNYIFDITAINLLLEYPELARIKAKNLLLGQLITEGVDDATRVAIENSKSTKELYKPIKPNMSSKEILKQMRINVAIAIYEYLPFEIRPFFLKGVLKTGEEMLNNGSCIEEVNEAIRVAKQYIDGEKWEKVDKTLKHYFEGVLYAPSAPIIYESNGSPFEI